MEGCSVSTDGPSLHVLEILRKLQSIGFCLDIDASVQVESSQDNLSFLFDQILSVFLKEIYQKQEIRPLPPMLGDGRSVDLFKLYWAVRQKGRFDSVTANRSWALVAEEIGFDLGVGSSLKLIYVKYLDAVDRWLWKVLEKKVTGEVSEGRGNLGSLGNESESEAKGSTPLSSSKKDQFLTPVRGNGLKLQLGDCDSDDDVMALDAVAPNGGFSSLKRKREALVGMLNWVIRVARNPGDPSFRVFSSSGTTYKDHAVGEIYTQVLLARQAMFLKKIPCMDNDESFLQTSQKMHSSPYEDYVGLATQTNNILRCSQRIHSVNKQYHSGSYSETATAPDDDNLRLRNFSLLPDVVADLLQKRIPVGPSFQAEVPYWTGTDSSTFSDPDDLKWLGTKIWPPEEKENRSLIEWDPIGKGRQDTCGCERPGSVSCVRFHVAEKRFRLKRELASAFHGWRFNYMGEEVALSWTEEEEEKFKAVVRLNPPSLGKSFWDQLYLRFPSKRKQNLVRYYFNVFLLRRRSYQNRVTPNSIDSDDDEAEFGLFSNGFGHDAVRVHEPKPIFCAQNAQCIDLDGCTDIY